MVVGEVITNAESATYPIGNGNNEALRGGEFAGLHAAPASDEGVGGGWVRVGGDIQWRDSAL